MSELRRLLLIKHTKQYAALDYSDKGKTPLSHYLLKNKYNVPKTSGSQLRWLTWLFTGHSPLAYFQHVANNRKFATPSCEHCGNTEETSEHFLCSCVGYMTITLRIFGKLITTIEEMATSDLSKLISYIKQTGRFDKEDLFG